MNTVKVLYKYVDGAHFFVANDEASTGLCVAHTDIEIAYNAVGDQLKKLFKANHDLDAIFEPAMSSKAFSKWLDSQQNAASSNITPGIAGLTGWTPELLAA